MRSIFAVFFVGSLILEVLFNCEALYLLLVLLLCEILLDSAALYLLLVYCDSTGYSLLLALGSDNVDEVIKGIIDNKFEALKYTDNVDVNNTVDQPKLKKKITKI